MNWDQVALVTSIDETVANVLFQTAFTRLVQEKKIGTQA
jgi:hypothetical protein